MLAHLQYFLNQTPTLRKLSKSDCGLQLQGGKEKRKREDISDDNTLCNINFEIGCVD